MPVVLNQEKTPSGHVILRMTATGDLSSADVDVMKNDIYPGRRSHGLPQLIVPGPGSEVKMGTSFRERLGELAPKKVQVKIPVALVLKQPLLRTALEFILKVLSYNTAKLFPSEDEAMRWLEQQIPRFKAKEPPYA